MAENSDEISLDELLERERVELMQISSIMRCLKDVLLYSDDDDGVMHSDVAKVSSDLLNDCIHRLELLRNRIREKLYPPDDAPPAEGPAQS